MKPIIILIVAQMTATAAAASDARFLASLSRLDPNTRLEQICDLYAMNQISRDPNPYHPDRAKTDVVTHPRHSESYFLGLYNATGPLVPRPGLLSNVLPTFV